MIKIELDVKNSDMRSLHVWLDANCIGWCYQGAGNRLSNELWAKKMNKNIGARQNDMKIIFYVKVIEDVATIRLKYGGVRVISVDIN
jgi:hypothetical protein